MATTSTASRPSPLSNYMQHLQQKNNNKPTFLQPIKSGRLAGVWSQRRRATTATTTTTTGAPSSQPPQASQPSNNNNNNKLPVWKERQLRATRQDSTSTLITSNSSNTSNKVSSSSMHHKVDQQHCSTPASAGLAMTVQRSNGEREVRRIPKFPQEANPALVDKVEEVSAAGGAVPSASLTYVSSSSTESNSSGRSSTTTSDRSTPSSQDDQAVFSTAIVPFSQDVVNTLEEDDINAESLYQELIVRNQSSQENHPHDHPHEQDSTSIDALTQMIDDCAARWQGSARVSASQHRASLVSNHSDDSSPKTDSRKEEIIAQQRAEIKYLRARLAAEADEEDSPRDDHAPAFLDAGLNVHHDRSLQFQAPVPPPPPQAQQLHHHQVAPLPPPMEQIDSVPIEHIEVAADDGDLCSVTSGLTNLADLSRLPDDQSLRSTAISRRPDAESVAGARSVQLQQQQEQRVTDQPLMLRAADGSSRKALYTGSVQPDGALTGVGCVLKFVETGDFYAGQVVQGEMHGQGTYTFCSTKRTTKKRPHKVLRGLFENNVYVGWNPDAAFWNDSSAISSSMAMANHDSSDHAQLHR